MCGWCWRERSNLPPIAAIGPLGARDRIMSLVPYAWLIDDADPAVWPRYSTGCSTADS
jgi:hypothetical protein